MRTSTRRIAHVATMAAMLAATSMSWAGEQIPIKGTITSVPIDVIPGPITTETRLLTGQVSHLGRVQGILVEQIDFQQPPFSFSGEFTLAAANGDLVFGTLSGDLDPITGHIQEELLITGGTCRFAGFTGSATGEGQAFSDGRAQEYIEGTLTKSGK